MSEFDLIVIGSGPGGYRAAVLAKLRGLSVAIIEKADWGGCCLNRGCVPKKDWHHTAHLVAASKNYAKRGIHGNLTADITIAWRHQKDTVQVVRDSYLDYMKRLGIASFKGTGSFVDAHKVSVDGQTTLQGKHIVIATGSSAFIPDVFPIAPEKILTTDNLFDSVPPRGRKVAIIGSGVIGTEFAFILAMLGKRITWVTQSEPLSKSSFSKPALKLLSNAMEKHKIVPHTGSRTKRVDLTGPGVTLNLDDGSEINVDWVLLGTGRIPHTEGLNLASAGVTTDTKGFVKVNEYLQSDTPHIYAIGDVANPHMSANHALADAAVVVSNILSPQSRKQQNQAVPQLVYSALELGIIGISEDEAEDEGLEAGVGFASFEGNPRALGQDEQEGFVRLIADMDSGALLGAEVIGSEAGELIHLIAQQFGQEDALNRFASTFYNHPARAEEVLNATETLAAKWGLSEQVFGK